MIVTRFRELSQRLAKFGLGKKWLACQAVTVREGDGATWVAEELAQQVNRAAPNFKLNTLSPHRSSLEALPQIADLVGRRRFLRLVSSSGLGTGFPVLNWWMKPAMVIVALAITSIFKIIDVELDFRLSTSSGPKSVLETLVLLAGFTLFNLGVQEIAARLSTRPDAMAIRRLRGYLEEQISAGHDEIWGLVDKLARELCRGQFPRTFILDHWSRLDRITREVFLRYIERFSTAVPGAEFWILVEGADGKELSLRSSTAETSPLRDLVIFDVIPLEQDERNTLSGILGHAEQARFTTVKNLCAPIASEQRQYLKLLQQHRLDHPAEDGHYDDIDFLYFLWLDAEAWHETIEYQWLRQQLARKEGLRADLLRQVLPGTASRVEEFEKVLTRLEITLSSTPLVTVTRVGGVVKLTLHQELGATLDGHRVELDLPQPGLSHAFWAVFWFDKLRNHPLEAFWLRKLATHLRYCDFSGIENSELYAKSLIRGSEALAFTISGSVRSCVYEPLSDLLRRAELWGEAEALSQEVSLLKKLRNLCWECYSLTGNEVALTSYLHLFEKTATFNTKIDSENEPSVLTQLFVESTPRSGVDRRVLRRALLRATRSSEEEDSVAVSITLRASALALAAFELTNDVPGLDLLQRSVAEAREKILEMISKLNERIISTPPAEVTATDLADLNMALWCLFRMAELDLPSRETLTNLEAQSGNLGFESLLHRLKSQLATISDLLVETADNAVILASELSGSLDRSAGADLVRRVLARELFGTAATSVAAIASRAPGGLEQRQLQRVVQTIADACEQLKIGDVEVSIGGDLLSPQTLRGLRQATQLTAFLWRQFELSRMELLTHSRSLTFTMELDGELDVWGASQPLHTALLEAKDRLDQTALFSHFLLSGLFSRKSAELRADFLLPATQLLLGGDFGDLLKRDASLMAIFTAHHLNLDLGIYLEFLVRHSEQENKSALAELLETQGANEIERCALALFNAARGAKDKGLIVDLRRALELISRDDSMEEKSRTIQSLLDYFSALEIIEKQPSSSDVNQLLENWRVRKGTWFFAALLSRIIAEGDAPSALVEEGQDVISRTHTPGESTAHLFLGLQLSELVLARENHIESDLPSVIFMSKSVRHWESRITADQNASIYRILVRANCPPREYVAARASYWSIIQLEHAEASQLRRLLESGRLFHIFDYYFRFLSGWGIAIDCDAAEYAIRLEKGNKSPRETVEHWRTSTEEVPLGFSNSMVSVDFVVLGRQLFHPDMLQDSSLNVARERFNAEARRATPLLLRSSSQVPTLPTQIKELIANYATRFQRFTVPEEDNY